MGKDHVNGTGHIAPLHVSRKTLIGSGGQRASCFQNNSLTLPVIKFDLRPIMLCTQLVSKSAIRPFLAVRRFLLSLLTIFALWPLAGASAPSGLEGTWNGKGWVSFSSGKRENARCRINFSGSVKRYLLTATCATESGRISQTASVRQAGANAYVGSFYNGEYDVSGTIRITTRGTPTARLTSGSGSAVFTLSR